MSSSVSGARETSATRHGVVSAARIRITRWRDPRLWVGVLLVLASIVVGARVLASADDTTEVWTLTHDVVQGAPVKSADLAVTRVHFDDEAVAARYLDATIAIPDEARYTRAITAGDLLSTDAIAVGVSASSQLLPLQVDSSGLPVGLQAGDEVDVWAIAKATGKASPPIQVLREASVAAVRIQGPAGAGEGATVMLRLPGTGGTPGVSAILAAVHDKDVVLVLDGG